MKTMDITTKKFNQKLRELGFDAWGLARKLQEFGDYRELGVIAKSIQNVQIGKTQVRGELWAILSLLDQKRIKAA